MKKEKNFATAVAYIHNNEHEIDKFCKTLYTVLDEKFEKYEVIFVDDHSSDNSLDKIKENANKYKSSVTSVVNMSVFHGVDLAMNAGVDLAIGDFVFEFDSVIMDYPKEIIMEIYNKSLSGFDIVSATPNGKTKPKSRLFYSVFNKFSGYKHKLIAERFRVLSRRAINRVKSLNKSISYRKAAYINCGLSVDYIKYKPTKMALLKRAEKNEKHKDTAFNSLILFTDVAYRISMAFTTFLFTLTLGAGLYTIIVYLNSRATIAGWTTTMLVLAGGFSGMFLVFAIIIKYLSILVELILKKQEYLIESVGKVS